MANPNDIASRIPASAISGIGWPAIPSRQDAAILSVAYQQEQTQWWSAERLAAHQLRQLQVLVRYAQQHVPFYRERLADTAKLLPGKLDIEAWRRIPVLRRSEAQAAGKHLIAQNIPTDHGKVQKTTTSGSTGQPMTVHRCSVSALNHAAISLRYHQWFRRDLTAKTLLIRTVSKKEELTKTRSWVPGYRTAPQTMLDISRPIPELFEELLKHDPAYLQTHPSTLEGLIKLSRETGRRPGNLREARTFGEVLDDSLRRLCRDVWGVGITNNYASEEFAIIALQCPENDHLHVQAESVMVEVLDADNRPCAPGEVGRIVATGLHNFVQPLIRYETGDMAEVGAPCSCGRGLPVLTRVFGRVRNLVVLPDGSRRHPVLDEAKIIAAAPVSQYQLIQTTTAQVELRLVTPRPLTPQEISALSAVFNEGLGHGFEYVISYHEKLHRTARGKFEIFRTAF